MADYRVVGALALVKGSDGKVRYYYDGASIPDDIDKADLERLEAIGLVAAVDGPQEPVEAASGPVLPRPAQVAPKSEWEDYAVSRGMTRAKADSLSKRELIDALPAE